MKNSTNFLIILFIAFTACKKDSIGISPSEAAQIEMEKTLQKQLNPNAQLSFRVNEQTPPNSCQLPECNFVIDEQYGILLAKANESCLPASNCVECCMNNWLAFVLMYVEPTAPKCNHTDYNPTILESF